MLINSIDCNAVVCCGDYNTSFVRTNCQTECLNNFNSRNKLCVSWNHPISKKESNYTNYTLNHFSCIDHIITTQNIFDCIVSNYIISELWNPSSHKVIMLY